MLNVTKAMVMREVKDFLFMTVGIMSYCIA